MCTLVLSYGLLKRSRSLFFCTFCLCFFAVRSFSPEEVLSELIQPPGPHCSSPGRIPPASGTFRRFLVDRQKGGPLQFFFSCSGKGNFLTMFLLLWSYCNYAATFSMNNSSSFLFGDKSVVNLHLAGWKFAIVPMLWFISLWSTYVVVEIPLSFCLAWWQ